MEDQGLFLRFSRDYDTRRIGGRFVLFGRDGQRVAAEGDIVTVRGRMGRDVCLYTYMVSAVQGADLLIVEEGP